MIITYENGFIDSIIAVLTVSFPKSTAIKLKRLLIILKERLYKLHQLTQGNMEWDFPHGHYVF
jgi:hypothetical protein